MLPKAKENDLKFDFSIFFLKVLQINFFVTGKIMEFELIVGNLKKF